MTWLKLSDDFSDECAELSDAAYRSHVEALGWCMRRETGGLLTKRDIRRCLETEDPWAAVDELLEAGFWVREGESYRIVHHINHQPEPDVLARRRERAAERQRKQRRKQAGLSDPARSQRESQRDERSKSMRDPGRVGTGRAGTGGEQPGPAPKRPDGKQHQEATSERCPACSGEGCDWCAYSGVDPYAEVAE